MYFCEQTLSWMTDEMKLSLEQAKARRQETRQFLLKLHKKKPKKLDQTVSDIHDEVFDNIDCLQCANCCKTTSPVFTDKDIDRIARHVRIKPSELVESHLHLDDENDYVLNSSPCTFLAGDNTCLIYDVRPKACREYPHTNRKRFHQIWKLTATNAEMCPATAKIVEELKGVSF